MAEKKQNHIKHKQNDQKPDLVKNSKEETTIIAKKIKEEKPNKRKTQHKNPRE
ncbi:hypothetical protein [Escherichia coli]|uniref:hypothetical protein n=1 Tax=Escherichia coli TaxID=562 RepID=UPI000B05532C|nr:hypothetical protein [Escherichia coli]